MSQLLAATLDAFSPARAARPRALLVPLVALVLVCGGVAIAVQAATGGSEPQTIALSARGMAFYLPGDPTPNPRLVVDRGEAVRLVLRNEDQGIPHDVAVPDEDDDLKATRLLRAAGESADLTFRAPAAAGEYEYVCTAHSRMMRGVLEVR